MVSESNLEMWLNFTLVGRRPRNYKAQKVNGLFSLLNVGSIVGSSMAQVWLVFLVFFQLTNLLTNLILCS